MNMRVLVIEDGTEYCDAFSRFLTDGFEWERAGSGPEALRMLSEKTFDAIFCDMKFDRAPEAELLGDVSAVADQFNGDPLQARAHLEDHQGTYILAAVREQGISVPVIMSYDFDGEPRRWQRLQARYAPVDYLPGNQGPLEIAARLRRLG
jgi:DNA-binding response OmpR family regulator